MIIWIYYFAYHMILKYKIITIKGPVKIYIRVYRYFLYFQMLHNFKNDNFFFFHKKNRNQKFLNFRGDIAIIWVNITETPCIHYRSYPRMVFFPRSRWYSYYEKLLYVCVCPQCCCKGVKGQQGGHIISSHIHKGRTI